MPAKKIIILTGEVQTGKTTLLQQWATNRKDVTGILTPVRNGERFFYFLQKDRYLKMEAGSEESDVLQVGRFIFSASAFREVTTELIKLMEQESSGYVVIDEIGPLEMLQKKGLYEALLKAVAQESRGTIILVVRIGMLHQVLAFIREKEIESQVVSIQDFMQLVKS